MATASWIANSAQGLATASGADDPASTVLTQIASGASAHVGLLGGEWTPPQRPTPSPTVAPQPAATSSADLVAALAAGYQQARDQAAVSTGDQAALLAAVALWRANAAHQLAAVTEGVDPATLPSGEVDVLALGLSTLEGVEDLVRGLDAAAFGYETIAARAEDENRAAAWNSRAAALRRTGRTLANTAGFAGGADDPREAIYDVADLVALPGDAAAATIETELASLWVQASVPSALRPVTTDAALASLRQAAALAPMAALDDGAGLLPGLTLPLG